MPDSSDFDRFYSVYPHQTGIGAARKSFAAQIFFHAADPAQIIAATKAYAEKHKDTDKRFIPRPARFLDDQTYLDPDLQTRITAAESMRQLDGKAALLFAAIGPEAYQAWFKNAKFEDSRVILEKQWFANTIFNHYTKIAAAVKSLGLTLC